MRAHDAIKGVLYFVSIFFAPQFGLNWIYIALGVAVLKIVSSFTKFCPMHTILNKLMPDTTPIQNGK
jgi:hypothetical protein